MVLAASNSLAASQASPASRLIADFETYTDRVDPIGAGQSGDRAALARLPDDSVAAMQQNRLDLLEFRRRAQALKPDSRDPETALNLELLARQVDQQIEAIDFDAARINFDSYSGFHLLMSDAAASTVIGDAADARAWIMRLRALPHFYDVEIANARRGVRTGFTQPKPTVEAVLAVARRQAESSPEDSLLLTPLRSLPPTFSEADAERLRAEAALVLVSLVKPAQRRFVAFLETEYRPNARAGLATRDLPGGEAYYAWLVRRDTTTQMTPDQIHALGEREVARIRAQMEALIASTGFTGGFQAFQSRLRSDPAFYAKTPEALLERSAMFDKETDASLPRFFITLPRLPFTVKPIPAESAEGATTAYYEQGSVQLGVAGTYRVNTTHVDQRPLYEIPALSLHESAPGHHLQIALAQERIDLPRFRRDDYLIAFEEGWALYAEQLGVEMGSYKTPYENFGRLSYEMWRACRLVADTGLHWLRWSREQARACFADNTALSAKNIEVELDRYISWPGQALAYKIGELKIMALRRRAEAALGPRFDLRRFHDAVLRDGPLPLDILERRIELWITASQTPSSSSAAPSF